MRTKGISCFRKRYHGSKTPKINAFVLFLKSGWKNKIDIKLKLQKLRLLCSHLRTLGEEGKVEDARRDVQLWDTQGYYSSKVYVSFIILADQTSHVSLRVVDHERAEKQNARCFLNAQKPHGNVTENARLQH